MPRLLFYFCSEAWDENPKGRQAFEQHTKTACYAVFSLTVRATADGEGRQLRVKRADAKSHAQSPLDDWGRETHGKWVRKSHADFPWLQLQRKM